jgi:hypothetical protein
MDQLHKGTFAQIIFMDTNTQVTFAQIKLSWKIIHRGTLAQISSHE